ncbi:MAG TPA: hypothetical protein VNI84_12415 [Pyrinomonadaceae bacterium]|nr:hypothetical protein [Pyrinomonadaceae bacterium]
MNKKSNQIENELVETSGRLVELTEMRGGINTNLQSLQKGFIDGKTSLDELQAEQSKLTTLDSSIKALQIKQDELHTAFQKASLSETRQALREKARSTAIEAEIFHTEFISVRNEFHDLISDYAEKTLEKMTAWRTKQKDFRRIASETELTFKELEELGLTTESYKAATAEHINPVPLEYGAVVEAAVNTLIIKLDGAWQAERRAAFDRGRAASQEKIKAQIEAENNKPKPLVVTYDHR